MCNFFLLERLDGWIWTKWNMQIAAQVGTRRVTLSELVYGKLVSLPSCNSFLLNSIQILA